MILWGFLGQVNTEPFSKIISGHLWEELLLTQTRSTNTPASSLLMSQEGLKEKRTSSLGIGSKEQGGHTLCMSPLLLHIPRGPTDFTYEAQCRGETNEPPRQALLKL